MSLHEIGVNYLLIIVKFFRDCYFVFRYINTILYKLVLACAQFNLIEIKVLKPVMIGFLCHIQKHANKDAFQDIVVLTEGWKMFQSKKTPTNNPSPDFSSKSVLALASDVLSSVSAFPSAHNDSVLFLVINSTFYSRCFRVDLIIQHTKRNANLIRIW